MGVMKNEQIFSESWYASRQPSFAGVPLHLWENLYDLDGGLQRMEESLANTPIGGVGYTTKTEAISNAMDNTGKLNSFACTFTYDVDDLIDEKFYLSIHNDVLEILATIDASKLTTNNTLGLQGTRLIEDTGYSGEIKQVLGSLNLGDFLGYNPTDAAAGQMGRQQVPGFVNLFQEKYNNFMAGNTDEDFKNLTPEEFAKMLIPGEFYVEREVSGWLKFVDMLSDILIVPAIVDACLGYDWITGDHLTQSEQDMRVLGAAVSAIVTVVTFGQAWAAAGSVKALAKILLVSVISDVVATGAFAASDAMGMPPAVSAVIALIAGIASGNIATDMLFKNGVVNTAVLDDIMNQMGDQIDDAARRFGCKNDDIVRIIMSDPSDMTATERQIFHSIYQNDNGLDVNDINRIINAPQGSRPNPSEYLSSEYISQHLDYFDNGVTKIQCKVEYDDIGMLGEKTFVMPSDVADDLIRRSNGDVKVLEDLLGISPGGLGDSPVRVDIPNPPGLEFPSGNEIGANEYWVPGGYTNGGIMEAAIDSVPVTECIIKPVFKGDIS